MNSYSVCYLAFALVCVLSNSICCGQGLSPEILRKLKASTVFVKAETLNDLSRGSGFFIDRNLIVTNSSILRLEQDVPPKSISVVVDSGTSAEREYEAELVAYDTSGDISFLSIRSSSTFSSPDFLTIGKSSALRETQNLFLAGFPFGEQLGETKYPAVTISPCTVSSFRKNSLGYVELIQINGNLVPGNSGGPIIDTSGQVVGVSKKMITATQIGFAVPADNLKLNIAGRIVQAKTLNVVPDGYNYSFQIYVRTCDPFRKISKLGAYYWTGTSGSQRPVDSSGIPTYGAAGDGTRYSIMLERSLDDATGQTWTANISKFRCEMGQRFWLQPTWLKVDGSSQKVSSVDHTQAFMDGHVRMAEKSNPRPPSNMAIHDFKSPLGELVPPALVPAVQPDRVQTVKLAPPEPDGIPFVETKIKSYPIRDVTQLAVTPSGDAVYVAYAGGAVIEKFSPDDFTIPKKGAAVPAGSEQVWCDEQRVVVGCARSSELLFLDRDLRKITRSITIPNFKLHAIAGRAPDNSIITAWHYKRELDEPHSKKSLYLVNETGEPRNLGRERAERVVFCFENQRLLLQQFRGRPSGAPTLYNLSTQSPQNISQSRLISPAGMHRDFYPIFSTHDGNSLVFSFFDNDAIVTKLVSPGLERVQLTFPGATIAEHPAENLLIAAHTVYDKEFRRHPEILYVDRETGKILRKIRDSEFVMNGHFYSGPMTPVFVPGHELVIFYDHSQINVMRCGPLGTGKEVVPDVGPPEVPPDLSQSNSLLDRLTHRFRNPVEPEVVVPSVAPAEEFMLDATKESDASGLPITKAILPVETVQLGDEVLLQVVADPSGERLYAIFENHPKVFVFETVHLKKIGEITVPQMPVALWCGPSMLAVACDESKLIAFVDKQTGKLNGTSRLKNQPKQRPFNLVGPAPDGSLITIWEGVQDQNQQYIYLISPGEDPFHVMNDSGIRWCALPFGPNWIWTQNRFEHGPSGALELYRVEQKPELHHLVENAFGRRGLMMHRDCGHAFLSDDRSRFIVPLALEENDRNQSARAFRTSGHRFTHPMRTLIVQSDLSNIVQEVPGAVLAESATNDCYISWRPSQLLSSDREKSKIGVDVLYVSRSTGRVFREFHVPGFTISRSPQSQGVFYYRPEFPIQPTGAPSDSELPRAIYVSGREQLIVRDTQRGDGIGRVQVLRCGPIPADAAVFADVKPWVAEPPTKVIAGQSITYDPGFSSPEGKRLTFRIVDGIPGFDIDPDTGRMTITPQPAYLGKYDIRVEAVADGKPITVLSWVIEIDLPAEN